MKSIIPNITSKLSIRIFKALEKEHKIGWCETLIKTDYTIWNILDGDIQLTINNCTHQLSEGDVVFFYPGDTYTATTHSGCKFLFIYFSMEVGQSTDLLGEIPLSGVIPKKYIRKKQRTFSKKFLNMYTTAQKSTLKLYLTFLEYFTEITEIMSNKNCIHFHQSGQRENLNITLIIQYIESHLADDLSTKVIASHFHLSDNYFAHVFKQYTGSSPGKYITDKRMRTAMTLLTENDIKIEEVAHMVGYSNQFSFSKAFKRLFNISPSHCRL